MPLPPLIQTTDTFNTWFDATNNLISHVSNTSEYVLVDGATSTGDISLNGTMSVSTLVANGNVVIGGTSLGDINGLIQAQVHPVTGGALILSGNSFYVGMRNVVVSSETLTINPNTVFQGPVVVNAVAQLAKNAAITIDATSNVGLLEVRSSSTVNTVAVGNGSFKNFTVTYDKTPPIVEPVTTVSVNSTIFIAHTTNTTLVGTNLSIRPNTVINGTALFNNTVTINAITTFDANVVFDAGVLLGGPVLLNPTFIYNAPELSGTGADTLTANLTASVYRITVLSGINEKNIRAIETTSTEYRQLMLFNNSSANLYFTHNDVGETTPEYRILCPRNQPFQIAPQGTALLYYDAASSVRRWRVISAPTEPDASNTVIGNINLGAQRFAGNKTFENAASFLANVTINGSTLFVDAVNNRVGINNATPLHSFRVDGTISLNGAATLQNTASITGNATFSNTVSVTGAVNALSTLGVTGTFTALGSATLNGAAGFSNTITVAGNATFNNTVSVSGNVTFSNTVTITGNVVLSNTLSVTGNVTLQNVVTITGNVAINDRLTVTRVATLSNTLSVTGAATLSNTLAVTGGTTLSNTLGVTGVTTLSNTLGVTGATTLSNTLGVTGVATLNNNLTVTGNVTFSRASYLSHIIEPASIVASPATGAITLNIASNPVVYYTANSTGNWTLNLTGNSGSSLTLNQILSVGQSITCSFLSTQNTATAHYATAINVDGVAQSVKWQNGITPSVGASTASVDLYTFVIIKTSATPTYTVFGGINKFA